MKNRIIIPSHELLVPRVRIPVSSMCLEGKVQCSVIDGKTKQVLKVYPEQNNLILNQGMNNFATTDLADLYLYAVAGTGNTPTKDDSGVTTATQALTTVTLAGGAFVFTNTATDAGKMIKWDSGQEARIVTVTDATHAVVSVSQAVGAGEFTVYRTNQVGLTTETKRSNTYFVGSGNCGVSYDDVTGKLSGFRTYDFSIEVGAVTYTEVGFSASAVVANNLNSRILLTSGVVLAIGQQLRVKYTLSVTQSPAVASSAIAVSPITGWATATGTAKIQHHGLSFPNQATGATTYDVISAQNSYGGEPNRIVEIRSSSASTAHAAWRAITGLGSDIYAENCVLSAYTALDFFREKQVNFGLLESNSAVVRSLCISSNANDTPFFRYLINSNQTKDAFHTLQLNFRLTWGRTLA